MTLNIPLPNKHQFWLKHFTGTVFGDKRWSDTHVYGGGGGGYIGPQGGQVVHHAVKSDVIQRREFWLRSDDGVDSQFEVNIPATEGQRITIVWGGLNGQARGPFLKAYNHNSRETYSIADPDEILRKVKMGTNPIVRALWLVMLIGIIAIIGVGTTAPAMGMQDYGDTTQTIAKIIFLGCPALMIMAGLMNDTSARFAAASSLIVNAAIQKIIEAAKEKRELSQEFADSAIPEISGPSKVMATALLLIGGAWIVGISLMQFKNLPTSRSGATQLGLNQANPPSAPAVKKAPVQPQGTPAAQAKPVEQPTADAQAKERDPLMTAQGNRLHGLWQGELACSNTQVTGKFTYFLSVASSEKLVSGGMVGISGIGLSRPPNCHDMDGHFDRTSQRLTWYATRPIVAVNDPNSSMRFEGFMDADGKAIRVRSSFSDCQEFVLRRVSEAPGWPAECRVDLK